MLNRLFGKGGTLRSDIKKAVYLISSAFVISACGGPYPDLSNYELQEMLWDCKSKSDSDMTPAMGVKCNNAERECKVRLKAGRISSCS